MAKRNVLHISKLEDLKKWMVKDGWELLQLSNNPYEVLRASKAGRPNPLIIYSGKSSEHISFADRDMPVIGAFLRDQKKPQTNADRIRSMTDEELAEFLPIASNFICQPTEECIRNTVTNHCGECERTEECAMKWLRAESEGVGNLFYDDIGYGEKNYGTEVDTEYGIAKEQFAWLWESTIKKSDLDRYGWDANPWVWVIEFERCEKPEGV